MNDEANELGRRLVRILVVAALFVIGMMVWGKAWAQDAPREWKNQIGDYVILVDAPCLEPKVLQWINANWHARYKSMDVSINGRKALGCWFQENGEQNVSIVYEDGSNGQLPAKLFRSALGV